MHAISTVRDYPMRNTAAPTTPGSLHAGREFYLAGYDIANRRRLVAALKLVRGHATGGQKTGHEVVLTHGERQLLLNAMRDLIHPTEDRFFLLKLDRRAPIVTRGTGVQPDSGRFFFVG